MSNQNTNTFAQGLYNFGRTLSMGVESGVIGLLPLLLLILEIISALAEASLVGQVMPYFEGSFIKALVYTGAGMGAGIFMAPAISWAYQLNKKINEVNSNKVLHKDFKGKYLENLKAARMRWVWVALFCFLVAFASHATTIFFMETAFSNKETMKLLEIKGMGEVPKTLAMCITVVGFLLDLLLGSTTSTKINPKEYYPDLSDREALLEENSSYIEMVKKERKVKKAMLEDILKMKKEDDDAEKKRKEDPDGKKAADAKKKKEDLEKKRGSKKRN